MKEEEGKRGKRVRKEKNKESKRKIQREKKRIRQETLENKVF